MRKLQALRQHLLEAVPTLRREPARLLTYIEDGRIRFARGAHLSHQYSVPVQIVITEFGDELDTVMIPLLQWLSRFEPDLKADEAVRFEAEILSNNRWDLALTVTLSERVVANVNCETNRIDVDHRMPAYPIDPCPVEHWQVYLRDADVSDQFNLIAEWGQSEDPEAP